MGGCFCYHGELEHMCELLVDMECVWLLLPVVWHVVNVPQDALHQPSRLPHLVLQGEGEDYKDLVQIVLVFTSCGMKM